MAKKTALRQSESEQPSWQTAKVVLPKILGITPQIYITFLYSLLALFILFCLFFLPGIAWPGAWVRVTSFPPGSAIFVGDKSYGYTPAEVFVPAGKTELVLKRPGFASLSIPTEIPNQLFLSWIFPARMQFDLRLEKGDPNFIIQRFESELSEIALAAPFEENRQPPPLFTDLKNDLSACGYDEDKIHDVLISFAPYVADYYLYRDLRYALSSQAPSDFSGELAFWEAIFPGKPFLPLWLWANSSLSDQYSLAQSSFWDELKTYLNPRENSRTALRSPLNGYFELPLGRWVQGPRNLSELPRTEPFILPHLRNASQARIRQNLITKGEYAAFIKSNSKWSKKNITDLIRQGLVDERYLEDWEDDQPSTSRDPVVNISAYAAEAFLDYYAASVGGRVRLPFDDEWEVVATTNPGMLEWMGNPYRIADYLLWSPDGFRQAGPGVVRSVRSNINPESGFRNIYQRGALPPQFCSPNLGFRAVIESR